MREFQLAIAKSGKSNLGLETQLCISKSRYFSYFSVLLVNDFLWKSADNVHTAFPAELQLSSSTTMLVPEGTCCWKLPAQTVCAAQSAVSKVQSCSAWWVKWEFTSVFCPCIPNSALCYLSF